MDASGYLRPAATYRTELEVSRSRFIATLACVESVEQARAFLSDVQQEMPDASHHVYAFVIGHGKSVSEGLSDAGEPTGTAGQPVMAVLRGSGLGDTIIVVTRYFGGIKLGTGGLVRAYTDAAKAAVAGAKTEPKIARVQFCFRVPYSLYDRVRRIIQAHDATVDVNDFAEDISITLTIEQAKAESFIMQLQELSAGKIIVQAVSS